MADFALKLNEEGNFVVADFICPTPEARALASGVGQIKSATTKFPSSFNFKAKSAILFACLFLLLQKNPNHLHLF